MKFRPWNGVYLSDTYLKSVEQAEAVTAEVLRIYHSHGVVPLIESKVKNEAELRHAVTMLADAAGVPVDTLLKTGGGGEDRQRVPEVKSAEQVGVSGQKRTRAVIKQLSAK